MSLMMSSSAKVNFLRGLHCISHWDCLTMSCRGSFLDFISSCSSLACVALGEKRGSFSPQWFLVQRLGEKLEICWRIIGRYWRKPELRIQSNLQVENNTKHKRQWTVLEFHKDTVSNETCILSNRPFVLVTKTWIQFTLWKLFLLEPSLGRMNFTLVFISGSTQVKKIIYTSIHNPEVVMKGHSFLGETHETVNNTGKCN